MWEGGPCQIEDGDFNLAAQFCEAFGHGEKIQEAMTRFRANRRPVVVIMFLMYVYTYL